MFELFFLSFQLCAGQGLPGDEGAIVTAVGAVLAGNERGSGRSNDGINKWKNRRNNG